MRDAKACQACFWLTATTCRTFVTNLTASTCRRTCKWGNRRWVVVRFDFHQDIDLFIMKTVLRFACIIFGWIKTLSHKAFHHRCVVLVGR